MAGEADVALVASADLVNLSEVVLGTGTKSKKGLPMSRGYPEGQHLRGAAGYTFLDAGAGILKTYGDGVPAATYWRDARPLHRDGGVLVPVNVKGRFVNYRCVKCGRVERFPTEMSPITSVKLSRTGNTVNNMFGYFGITGQHRFSFRAALPLKRGREYAHEFAGVLTKWSEEGLRLGRRKSKGKGLFSLTDLTFDTLTLDDIRDRAAHLDSVADNGGELKLSFFSDIVVGEDGALTEKMILRSIKNAAKFQHPMYEPYEDPTVSTRIHALPARREVYLDTKGKKRRVDKPLVVPRGAEVRMRVRGAPDMFWEALALAESCMGIGKRTSSGKGEFHCLV